MDAFEKYIMHSQTHTLAWQARNDDRHGHDAATRQTAAARQAVREIQQLYEMKDEVLPELKYTTKKKLNI